MVPPRRRGLCIVRDDFFMESHRLTHAVALPFRKKSRSAHLLGCDGLKAVHAHRDGSLSLPTFLRDARVQIFLEKMLRGPFCTTLTSEKARKALDKSRAFRAFYGIF